jgi:hypothetical protein
VEAVGLCWDERLLGMNGGQGWPRYVSLAGVDGENYCRRIEKIMRLI